MLFAAVLTAAALAGPAEGALGLAMTGTTLTAGGCSQSQLHGVAPELTGDIAWATSERSRIGLRGGLLPLPVLWFGTHYSILCTAPPVDHGTTLTGGLVGAYASAAPLLSPRFRVDLGVGLGAALRWEYTLAAGPTWGRHGHVGLVPFAEATATWTPGAIGLRFGVQGRANLEPVAREGERVRVHQVPFEARALIALVFALPGGEAAR